MAVWGRKKYFSNNLLLDLSLDLQPPFIKVMEIRKKLMNNETKKILFQVHHLLFLKGLMSSQSRLLAFPPEFIVLPLWFHYMASNLWTLGCTHGVGSGSVSTIPVSPKCLFTSHPPWSLLPPFTYHPPILFTSSIIYFPYSTVNTNVSFFCGWKHAHTLKCYGSGRWHCDNVNEGMNKGDNMN